MANIPVFNKIDIEKWERKDHFNYFYHQIKCRYTLNANIEISLLLNNKIKRQLKLYPCLLYIIARAVNENKEFRMSFDETHNLGYWNQVDPSYTIFHDDDKTFSDIWTPYNENFSVFYQNVLDDMCTYKNIKGIKPKPNCPPNFCPISSIPWLSFTNYSQDTYSDSDFLLPLIKFGKYYKQEGKTYLPIAVFVHHAVADGYHTCKLINDIQSLANTLNL